MTSLLAPPGPSVLDRVSASLDNVGEERLWAKSDADVIGQVAAALRVRAQADAVLLAAVGEVEARGLARTRGASSTRAWLTGAHRVDPGEAGMLVRSARSLRQGCAQTAAAMASGEVSLGQARVIIRSVQDLPDDLGSGLTAAGEATLIGYCQDFDPQRLALIGRRLAELIDPEGTQARDEQKLLDMEKTARNKRGLSLSADKAGAGRFLRGYADAEGAAIITAALDGLSAPIPATAAGQKDPRSPAQRRHDALIEVCRRLLAAGELPGTGDQTQNHHHHPGSIPGRADRCRAAARRLPALPQPERLSRLRLRNHSLLPRRRRECDRPRPGPENLHWPCPSGLGTPGSRLRLAGLRSADLLV